MFGCDKRKRAFDGEAQEHDHDDSYQGPFPGSSGHAAQVPWDVPTIAGAGEKVGQARLTRELESFTSYVQLNSDEEAVREEVVQLVGEAAQSVWGRRASVQPFGSFPAGLSSFAGDVDVCCHGASGRRPTELLASALAKHAWATQVEVINARIPIVTCTHAPSGVHVDVSFSSLGADGLETSAFLRHYCDTFPAFRPVVMFVKALLADKGVDKTFDGGIGSFKVYILVAALLDRLEESYGGPAPNPPPRASSSEESSSGSDAEDLPGGFGKGARRRAAKRQKRHVEGPEARRAPAPTQEAGPLLLAFLRTYSRELHRGSRVSADAGRQRTDFRPVFNIDRCCRVLQAALQSITAALSHPLMSSQPASIIAGAISPQLLARARSKSAAQCASARSTGRGARERAARERGGARGEGSMGPEAAYLRDLEGQRPGPRPPARPNFKQVNMQTPPPLSAEATAAKERGNACFEQREFAEAFGHYTRAIALSEGRHAVLYSNRSAAGLGLGAASAALEDARRCVALAPTWHKAHTRLGAALAACREHREAVASYEAALRLDPAAGSALEALGECRRRLEQHACGGGDDDDEPPCALIRSAEDAARRKDEGNAAFRAGRHEAAAGKYTLALAVLPRAVGAEEEQGWARLLSNRSAALMALGAYEEALRDARECAELWPQWGKAHGRCGEALLALGDWTGAVEAAQEGLRAAPRDTSLEDLLVRAAHRSQ